MRRLGAWILSLVPRSERELYLSEVDEAYERRVARRGSRGAGAWYVAQCVSFLIRSGFEEMGRAPDRIGVFGRDVLFSARVLLRRPGYLFSAVLILGIGTGGVATVYSVANWVLLRDVPGIGAPDPLTWVRLESNREAWSGGTWGISDVDVRRLRERMPSLEALEASADFPVHVRAPESQAATRATASLVTPGYFDALQMKPAVGRFFVASEHAALAGPAEVVLGFDLWRRYRNATGRGVGGGIEVNGRSFSVVGVTPEGFRGSELPGASDLWIASSAADIVRGIDGESALGGQLWNRLVGRRRPGVSSTRVAVEANAAMEAIRKEQSGTGHSFGPTHFVFRAYDGLGLDPGIRAEVERTVLILAGASAFLLLLAVANVANLALTRAASRRGLVAIRRALGAGSWRVVREPLVEGGLIGLAGATLGLGLARAGEWAFADASLATGGASLGGMTMGGPLIGVTVAVAVTAGLLAGLVPALSVRREKALQWLRRGNATPRAARLRSTLVVAQVALSGTLLVGAGLLTHTVMNLGRIDPGLAPGAFTFSVAPGLNDYGHDRSLARLADVERQVAAAVGTESVGIVFPAVMRGRAITSMTRVADAPMGDRVLGVRYWTTGAGFVRAVGMELVAGSGFRQNLLADQTAFHPVMINEAMARKLFPGHMAADAVGRTVVLDRDDFESTVTGVVRDARLVDPRRGAVPTVLTPYDVGLSGGEATVYVADTLPEEEMAKRVHETMRGIDARLPPYDEGTMGDLVAAMFAEERIVARLAATLGVIGLLLVAVGLHGVLSYSVHERTREFGVRVALGASTGLIRGEVLENGITLTVTGIVLGLPLTWLTSHLVESRLYEMRTLDEASYAGGLAGLVFVALFASWSAARRATRISPMDALRES